MNDPAGSETWSEPATVTRPADREGGVKGHAGNIVVLILAIAAGLWGWSIFVSVASGIRLTVQPYNALGTDYMVYWTAARAALAGNFGLLADPTALTAHINAEFQNWLSRPLPLFPWLYPPHFLLILAPFAALSFVLSYVLFQATTFAVAAAAGSYFWAGAAQRRMLWLIGLALAPAASANAVVGQNAFLTLAMLLAGTGLLGRRNFAAGTILGLLSYKPQFALMVPVALLAARNWQALSGAALSALLAVAFSVAAFGFEPWLAWFSQTLPVTLTGVTSDPSWASAGRLWGLSIWAWVTLMGAPAWSANAAQWAAVALAATCVWTVFRGDASSDRRMAVLLTATLVAAPHSSSYDLVLLAAAVLLLYREVLDGKRVMLNPSLLLLPWVAPLAMGPRSSPFGFALPVIMLWVLVILMRARFGEGDDRAPAR